MLKRVQHDVVLAKSEQLSRNYTCFTCQAESPSFPNGFVVESIF